MTEQSKQNADLISIKTQKSNILLEYQSEINSKSPRDIRIDRIKDVLP